MAGEETSLSLILSCCHNKSVLSCFSFSLFRTFLFWVGGHSSDETKCNGEAKLVIKQNNAPSHSFSRIYLCPFETEFWIYLCPFQTEFRKNPFEFPFPSLQVMSRKTRGSQIQKEEKGKCCRFVKAIYIVVCSNIRCQIYFYKKLFICSFNRICFPFLTFLPLIPSRLNFTIKCLKILDFIFCTNRLNIS